VDRADHREGGGVMLPLLLSAAALLMAPAHPAARARLGVLFAVAPGPVAVRAAAPLPALCAVAVGALVAVLVGGGAGLLLAVPAGLGVGWAARRSVAATASTSAPDPMRLAGGWDLLGASLRCGLPVPSAVRAVAEYLPPGPSAELRTIADRLALGADVATAWEVPDTSAGAKLARAARRSANSGAGLASAASAAAAELRAGAQDVAAARGQRAGVLITGPLGLCFLPAFLALGVVPVVIGLAGGLAISW
jgi:hypothetical protein